MPAGSSWGFAGAPILPIIGAPVVRSIVDEAPAYGAALQARWAVTRETSGSTAPLQELSAMWAGAM